MPIFFGAISFPKVFFETNIALDNFDLLNSFIIRQLKKQRNIKAQASQEAAAAQQAAEFGEAAPVAAVSLNNNNENDNN